MASLDKEIKVIALKGEKGNSAYQDAVENELFSGTLEEFMSTFATPEDYITRHEYKKVTQAEYDALEQSGQIINNCYYIITDDDTWDTIQGALSLAGDVETLQTDVGNLQDKVNDMDESLGTATTELENAQGDIDDLETDVASLQQDVGDMQLDILQIQTKTSIPIIIPCNTTSEDKAITTDFTIPIADGTEIYVKFANYGSNNPWHSMTLNINNTGSHYICVLNTPISYEDNPVWGAGDIVRLVCKQSELVGNYIWNVQENVTKNKYCGTLYNRG